MLSYRRIKICVFFVDETTCCVRRAFILRPCSVCSLSGNMDFYSLAAAHRKDAGRGENSSAPLVVSWSLSWEESLVLEWTSEKEMVIHEWEKSYSGGDLYWESFEDIPIYIIRSVIAASLLLCYVIRRCATKWLDGCWNVGELIWKSESKKIPTNKNPSRTYKRAIQKISEQKPSLEHCDFLQRTLWDRYIFLSHRRIYKPKG